MSNNDDTIDNNTVNISNDVLERISLLENEVKSLRKEVKRKERRRITYSPSTKNIGNAISSKSTSTQATEEDIPDTELSESMNAEDVFRDSTESNDATPARERSYSDSVVFIDEDETGSEMYEENDMKMAELAAMASDEVASMSSSKRSFRYNSFMTRRMNADDDYKVKRRLF